jgi:plastocyanin
MRFRTVAVIALVALGSLAALVPLAGGAGQAKAKTISLGDNFFSPDSTSVKSGTKVKFNWVGEKQHNVTKFKGPGPAFASETTDAPGIHFTKKFKKAGTYKLVCTIHEHMTMTLKVKK